MKNNRVFVVCDGDNLYYLQSRIINWRVDTKALLDYIEATYGKVVSANYYASYRTDNEKGDVSDTKRGFFTALSYMGYRLITRPTKVKETLDGVPIYKSNLDIYMVKDILLSKDQYDMVVLVSGDGDFDCIIDTLRTLGKEVKVFSTPGLIASELRDAAGKDYVDFQDIREQVELKEASEGGHDGQ